MDKAVNGALLRTPHSCPTGCAYQHPHAKLTTATFLSRAPHPIPEKLLSIRSCHVFPLLTPTAPLEHGLTDLLGGPGYATSFVILLLLSELQPGNSVFRSTVSPFFRAIATIKASPFLSLSKRTLSCTAVKHSPQMAPSSHFHYSLQSGAMCYTLTHTARVVANADNASPDY